MVYNENMLKRNMSAKEAVSVGHNQESVDVVNFGGCNFTILHWTMLMKRAHWAIQLDWRIGSRRPYDLLESAYQKNYVK